MYSHQESPIVHLLWSGPNRMFFFFVWCGSLSHCPFFKWTRNCKQNHTCAKVINSLDRNSQAGKSRKFENRLIMEIFRSAIVIILLIFFYQLQTQYADTYEHQMRQCHLYHVVTRILRRWRSAARRFRRREHAFMCAYHGILTVALRRTRIRYKESESET